MGANWVEGGGASRSPPDAGKPPVGGPWELSTPFHKYGLVFREDHSLTVVAPIRAGPRGHPVSKRSTNTCTNFRNGVDMPDDASWRPRPASPVACGKSRCASRGSAYFSSSARIANAVAMSGSSSFTNFSGFTHDPSARCVRFSALVTLGPGSTPSARNASSLEAA